jgi:hypothetical protein
MSEGRPDAGGDEIRLAEERVNGMPYAASSFGAGDISHGATHSFSAVSVAIARTFGLCCGFGVIVGAVSRPPIAFERNAKVRRKRES